MQEMGRKEVDSSELAKLICHFSKQGEKDK
jgi:hypothetical protein